MKKVGLGALIGLGLTLSASCDSPETEPALCEPKPEGSAERFVDRREALGISFTHHMQSDLCHLTDTVGGPGVCAFDFDGDDDIDLFFPDREGHPSALYRNNGEPGDGMRFEEVAAELGVASPGDAIGCLAFDYDADGATDLLVTTVGTDRLYRNEGGHFTDVTEFVGLGEESGFSTSATAGDIDGDGDLDLFIGRLVKLETCPDACYLFPINCEAEESLLYVNDVSGSGQFLERAGERGVAEPEPTLASLFFDEDADGDLDLYVGNDMGVLFPDRLYENDGQGSFHDRGKDRGYSGAGTDTMGVDVGDLDGDGVLEMVTTDFRDRPTRVYNCSEEDLPCSFESLPRESSDAVNWGIGLVDVDSDGDLDLFQSGGDVYDPDREGSPNQLFLNDGEGHFQFDAPEAGGGHSAPGVHRGVAFADLDRDGDVDVIVAHNGGAPRVLMNEGSQGQSLSVVLGTGLEGATVRVTAEGRAISEPALIGGSYLSSHDPWMHFGLGAACEAEVVMTPLRGVSQRRKARAGDVVRFSR